MTKWQPVETAPENTEIFCWARRSYHGCSFFVDCFHWTEETREDVESESHNAKGRRRIIQERKERVRVWERSWGADYWMPLPPPPTIDKS